MKTIIHVLFMFTLLAAMFHPVFSVRAAGTITVDTLADEGDGNCSDGDCSLRDAVAISVSGDAINFSVTGTITLSMGEIVINKNLKINGPGPNQLTISGNDMSRIFNVISGVETTISGLKIDHGYVQNGLGGGIRAANITSLTLDNVIVSNSVADATAISYPRGGGVGIDGGLLTITNSIVSGNSADYAGGGIAIMNNSSLAMTNVTVDDNHVTGGPSGVSGGGGMYLQSNPGYSSLLISLIISNNTSAGVGGGVYANDHDVILTRSIVFSNSASDDGGGFYNENSTTIIRLSTFNGNSATGASNSEGGAVVNLGSSGISSLTIYNSTFSDNSANHGSGGAIYNQAAGSGSPSATTSINNSTIVENTAQAYGGGGIFAGDAGGEQSSSITLTNSIIYGNTLFSGSNGENCAKVNNALIITNDHNLFESLPNDCSAGGTDFASSAALSMIVGPLAENGGPTQTHALPADSVAINAGNNLTCKQKDQRGVERPQGTACDIGAFEVIVPLILTSTGTEDGWILESAETSNTGGIMNSANTNFYLGDSAAKQQYRIILSFNTSDLPNDAVITKVTLKLKQQGFAGNGNPVTILQGFATEIKTGPFGSASLALLDFKTIGSKTIGPSSPALSSGWYSLNLTPGKDFINKLAAGGGLTQLRLRFKLDDNNNAIANLLKIYSGNAGAANRPQLIIEYTIP